MKKELFGEFWLPDDSDTPCILYEGWKIIKHVSYGNSFLWNPNQVEFYIHPKQTKTTAISGNELLEHLQGENVFNANVLYRLLNNPKAIPNQWKMDDKDYFRYIYFWGTVYEYEGKKFVLCMFWNGACWQWSIAWLSGIWMANDPALIKKM